MGNVKVEWVNNNRAALVSWTPLTLHQARGFPVYFVTYQLSSQFGKVVCAVDTVTTSNSSVLIGDLHPTTEYAFTVDVGTAGGRHRSTLAEGQAWCLSRWIVYRSMLWLVLMLVLNIAPCVCGSFHPLQLAVVVYLYTYVYIVSDIISMTSYFLCAHSDCYSTTSWSRSKQLPCKHWPYQCYCSRSVPQWCGGRSSGSAAHSGHCVWGLSAEEDQTQVSP